MNQLKCYIITGTIFVIFLGTISHFFYDWSGNNPLIGLFAPVNESTWEHMKLVFFPMLLFSLYAIPKFKNAYPCITSSLFSGILAGTALVPIIFYTYTGILGRNLFVLDLLTFLLAVIIAFIFVYKLTLSCRMQEHTILLCDVICATLICFLIFTVVAPDIGIFTPPH